MNFGMYLSAVGTSFIDGILAAMESTNMWIFDVLYISLLFQFLFFFVFIVAFLYAIGQRTKLLLPADADKHTPISFLFFIERWDNDETSKKLKNIAKRITTEGEVIVLITTEYMLEAKMVFNLLEKNYGDKFKVCQLHEKTKGLDIGKLALLSGVRMASCAYICFLSSSRKINRFSWEVVPKSLFEAQGKKKNLMVGYTRILGSTPARNTIVSLFNVHIQILSQALLHLGIKFLANPLNVAFDKEQYLKDPNVLKQSQGQRHLGSTFSHLNHTAFRTKVFWDKRLVVTDDYGINLTYFFQSGERMVRLMESSFWATVLLSLYTLSAFLIWFGLAFMIIHYEDMQEACLIELFFGAVAARCLLYWSTLIYLTQKVGEKPIIVWLMPILDIVFGIFSFPFGLIVWILKSFKKH